jgi:hypothetical protein
MAQLVHVGDPEAGQRAVAPFRALAEPLADLVRPMAYPEMYPPDDPEYRQTIAHSPARRTTATRPMLPSGRRHG